MTKVLVVDDEPGILRSTVLLLRSFGFEAVSTGDPAEVLGLLRTERPEVLLQDVRMPNLDIDGLMRSIRADPDVNATRVVLFSASMDAVEVAERLGDVGLLEKPFRAEDIVRVVREAVAQPPRAAGLGLPAAGANACWAVHGDLKHGGDGR